MSDDSLSIIFVFFQKITCTRKCNLVDVTIYLIGCHTNSTVTYGECFFLFVNTDSNSQIAQFAFVFAHSSQRFQLLSGVNSI